MSKAPSFRIWYAIYVNIESQVFLMRRSKAAAKKVIRNARKDFPDLKFGIMRLVQKIEPKRRRRGRRKQKPIPSVPDGFTLKTR